MAGALWVITAPERAQVFAEAMRAVGRDGEDRGAHPEPWIGVVDGEDDLGAAVSAALAGSPVLAVVPGGGLLADRLFDDLRRIGDAELDPPDPVVLSAEGERLLELLAAGATVSGAAATLHLSRRTATRRLTSICRRYGVSSVAEAVLRYQRDSSTT